MINFYLFKNKSYIVSTLLLLFTIIVIFFKGLNLGIDFKGGLNFEVKTQLENNFSEYFLIFLLIFLTSVIIAVSFPIK